MQTKQPDYKNTSHVCKVFTTYAEAQHYQIKYQGRIYSLQQQSGSDVECEDISVDEFLAKYGAMEFMPPTDDGPKLYVLVIDKSETLEMDTGISKN